MARETKDEDDKSDDENEEFEMKTKKSQLKDGVLEKFEQHEDSGERKLLNKLFFLIFKSKFLIKYFYKIQF